MAGNDRAKRWQPTQAEPRVCIGARAPALRMTPKSGRTAMTGFCMPRGQTNDAPCYRQTGGKQQRGQRQQASPASLDDRQTLRFLRARDGLACRKNLTRLVRSDGQRLGALWPRIQPTTEARGGVGAEWKARKDSKGRRVLWKGGLRERRKEQTNKQTGTNKNISKLKMCLSSQISCKSCGAICEDVDVAQNHCCRREIDGGSKRRWIGGAERGPRARGEGLRIAGCRCETGAFLSTSP